MSAKLSEDKDKKIDDPFDLIDGYKSDSEWNLFLLLINFHLFLLTMNSS
jgi:hypothetical protein